MSEHSSELFAKHGVLMLASESFFLRELMLCDVDRGADYPFASAGFVEYAATLGSNPAQNAVLFSNRAVFHIVERTRGRIGRAGIGGNHMIPILRMQPGIEVIHTDLRSG